MIFNDNGTVLTAANFVSGGVDKIYQPQNGTSLNTEFFGRSPATAWELRIYDVQSADVANLTYWQISVRTQDAAGAPAGCGDHLKRGGETCEDGSNDNIACTTGCMGSTVPGYTCSGGNWCAAD